MAAPRNGRIVTCEAVTSGHPDKLCDQISDALLDAHLVRDPYTRCGIEAAASGNEVWVFGQVASADPLSKEEIATITRRVIRDAGYRSAKEGIDPETCKVRVTLDPQSQDIAQGVVKADGAIGASDQGIVYGYATDETPEGLPLPLVLARKLTDAITNTRISKRIPWLRPDGKAQVSVQYVNGKSPVVTAFVLSAQHAADVEIEDARAVLTALALKVLKPYATAETVAHVNPAGRFVTGGPLADSGLTGRKVIADTYGGVAHHGGGAFSGKDGTKVDRSAAYAARHAALQVVRSGLASSCEIALSYAIGVEQPVAIHVQTTGASVDQLAYLKRELAERDFSPKGIIERLKLRTPIFERTARSGHFGRRGLPWEAELNEKLNVRTFSKRSDRAALEVAQTVSGAESTRAVSRPPLDAKHAFMRRVAMRWHLDDKQTPRWSCGHLRELNLRHLMPGESFPWGTTGASFLKCVICPEKRLGTGSVKRVRVKVGRQTRK